jgi:predicted nucleic acid-binding Zn ribbon protein
MGGLKQLAEPERAQDILGRLTDRMGITARLEKEKAVVSWGEAVGETVARKSKATSISNGILFVTVQNSMWLQELGLLKEGIIEKINSVVGKQVVKDIVFRVGDPGKE